MAKISHVSAVSAVGASQQIVEDAARPSVCKDKKGRNIELRQIKGLLRMKFLKMLGHEHENGAYVAYATLAACIASVNGEALRFPETHLQLEAVVERFDDGLLDEVAEHYRDAFLKPDQETADEAKN